MPLFRKKPVVIEARRVPEFDDSDVVAYVSQCVGLADWCGGRSYMMHSEVDDQHHRSRYYDGDPGYDHILIPTLEGDMCARPGDWIIKGVNGEYYPCKPDIFEKTYEAVDSQ